MIELLYKAQYQRLLRFCTSLTKSPAQAEDIVQEAFLRALAHADTLNEVSEAKCLAWLYRTAKNLFIDQVRRAAKALPDASEGFFEPDLSTMQVAMWINQLPESERTLFSLRYFQGFNATELGEMFNLPSSTVRARLMSARKSIQKLIHNERE